MTTTTAKKILSVKFIQDIDDDPDLSHLGIYSNTPKGKHIDRAERGDQRRGEYRYFNAGCGDPEYIEEDYKRAEAFNRGEWYMTYCYAKATIVVNGVIQTIQSGGIGRIESDSGDYLDEVKKEQLAELRDMLPALGFNGEEIDNAYADMD